MYINQSHSRPFIGSANRNIATGMLLAAALLSACAKKDAVVDSTTAMAPDPTKAKMETMAMPDDEMKAVLDQLASMGGKPIEALTPTEARMQPTPAAAAGIVAVNKGKDTTSAMMFPGITAVDRKVGGAAGQLPARVYTPEGPGPFPVIVYFHGGGWVIASKEVYDGGARALAKGANAVVVSVDYRLAPENKFPAQHDDALAAYKWVTMNAASLKGDPGRIALAGESAGGNLAVATAIAARDAKLIMPSAIIAVYPIAQADTMTPSYVANANAKPLNRPMIGWFAGHTTKTPADLQDPRFSLIKANLAGLPEVTIINAQIDPLLDDGKMLEDALKAANVSVERKVYDGVTHEFFGMGGVVGKAKDAENYATDRLKSAFERKK